MDKMFFYGIMDQCQLVTVEDTLRVYKSTLQNSDGFMVKLTSNSDF